MQTTKIPMFSIEIDSFMVDFPFLICWHQKVGGIQDGKWAVQEIVDD